MARITLHHYASPARLIQLEYNDVAGMTRQDGDAFTVLSMKTGRMTPDGRNTVHVSETEREIKAIAALARATALRQ